MSANQAVFTQGSTLRHILIMTSTSALGLVSLFMVDLVDMYFLSSLGQEELAASIGFAGTLLFFLTALSIGLQIGVGALVARSEGRHLRQDAKHYCASGMLASFLFSGVISLFALFYVRDILMFLGAKGMTLEYAVAYSTIILPSTAVLSVAMVAASVLRSLGNARQSMFAIVGGSLVNAVLDPVFIFGFGWGIEGAAIASVASRFAVFGIAFYALHRGYRFIEMPDFSRFNADVSDIGKVAVPAILTNLATPVGSSYVMKTMAEFGDDAVAASAIIGRIMPLAFAGLYALSGAIGPIIGQNAGAHLVGRVRATLWNAALVTLVYCLVVWLLLWTFRDPIAHLFHASAESTVIIDDFFQYLSAFFVFSGLLFIANASFNNLNKASYATAFNFARALAGTIPLVWFLSQHYGAMGVLAGEVLGGVIYGTIAYALVWIKSRDWVDTKPDSAVEAVVQPVAALSSSQSQLGLECEMQPSCERNGVAVAEEKE